MSFVKVIINEMLKGNFSFLILIVGLLQLVVMVRKGKKERTMTPQVYENLKELTYGELLSAIDRLREKMYDVETMAETANSQYYIELMKELDNRQKEL